MRGDGYGGDCNPSMGGLFSIFMVSCMISQYYYHWKEHGDIANYRRPFSYPIFVTTQTHKTRVYINLMRAGRPVGTSESSVPGVPGKI